MTPNVVRMRNGDHSKLLKHGDPAADQIVRGLSGGCRGDLISAPDSGYYRVFYKSILVGNLRFGVLTRSLPRDVYIRRKNDHPGGQGRIYTSNLNFVSTHLSKPGHRCGCCCMSPRCLLCQFVDRCLLFGAFFIEKTVLL